MTNRITRSTIAAILGLAGISSATYARVESMGKHATYFMDDISVFDNAANANLFPNYLMGELGQFRFDPATAGNFPALQRNNRDPSAPWFGAIFGLSMPASENSASRYPQVIAGAVFNRVDDLQRYIPDSVNATSGTGRLAIEQPVTQTDIIIGYATAGGVLFGARAHIALGDSTSPSFANSSSLMLGNVGVNMPLGTGLDLELSATAAKISYETTQGIRSFNLTSDLSLLGSVRAFYSVPAIDGEFVPALSFRQIDAPSVDETSITGGAGVNVSLDRGFFWIGADYTNSTVETIDTLLADVTSQHLRVSFGIERNVWWDWFVLRVGGQKLFGSGTNEIRGSETTSLFTNPVGNGTMDDHIGFGFGINIDDKLKVDAVVAEDLLFTGSNLFGGPMNHIFSRISATYSF